MLSEMNASALRKIRLLVRRTSHVPGLSRPIARLWNTYEHVKFVYYTRQNIRSAAGEAEINPFRLFWIPLKHLRKSQVQSFDFIDDTGKTIDGTWDCKLESISEYAAYELFEQRFRCGLPWTKTDYYQSIKESIRRNENIRYATIDELETKFDQYERMFEEFQNGEYRLQTELANEGEIGVPGNGGRGLFPSRTNRSLVRHEIAINVGRNGQLILNDGRHRACLALIAGLDEIPVRVVVRHEKWQSLRNEVAHTVDEALGADVAPVDIHEYVRSELNNSLENVFLGLAHPDLEVIFKRRLPSE